MNTITRFFNAVEIIEVEDDLDFYLTEMNDILADDYHHSSSDTLPEYFSKDEFLDLNTGFHTYVVRWNVASYLMGSNVIYSVIGSNRNEMKFPKRSLGYRDECSLDDDMAIFI